METMTYLRDAGLDYCWIYFVSGTFLLAFFASQIALAGKNFFFFFFSILSFSLSLSLFSLSLSLFFLTQLSCSPFILVDSSFFLFFLSFLLGWDFPRLAEEIVKRPYVLLGFAAWLTLFVLALTSTRGAIRRLGRHWKRLHSAVYIALALVAVR